MFGTHCFNASCVYDEHDCHVWDQATGLPQTAVWQMAKHLVFVILFYFDIWGLEFLRS